MIPFNDIILISGDMCMPNGNGNTISSAMRYETYDEIVCFLFVFLFLWEYFSVIEPGCCYSIAADVCSGTAGNHCKD